MATKAGARSDHTSKKAGRTVQVVEFLLGNERYAVDLFDTREVITTPQVTPTPNAPSYITGIIDLRGAITTIVDLRALMQITHESTGKRRSRVIILDQSVGEKRVGVLVDDVSSVSTYTQDEIDREACSSSQSGRDIAGVIRRHQRDASGSENRILVILLNIRQMIHRIEDQL